jgi:hypothetical protein
MMIQEIQAIMIAPAGTDARVPCGLAEAAMVEMAPLPPTPAPSSHPGTVKLSKGVLARISRGNRSSSLPVASRTPPAIAVAVTNISIPTSVRRRLDQRGTVSVTDSRSVVSEGRLGVRHAA